MNISSISLNSFKSNDIKKLDDNKEIAKNMEKTSQQKLPVPSASLMLAFTGGYSLDIHHVFKNVADYQFPQDVKEMVAQEIKSNPDTKKTLYDVHFEKYKGILDCYSLDELKEKYPEFQDVISVYDINAKEGSFADKFLNKECDAFPPNEDLTLQLIKLYWGQGFSLSDLSDFVAENSEDGKGINLHYLMTKKLNIPVMNHRYAEILKLSNKEYNEKFTSQMSIKLREAKEAKEQIAQGEPVIIPSGELSESHKKHISEQLKAHYKKYPEKILDMSLRQKRFYEENPEKRKEMSDIMFIAWNETNEGKSVLKYLRKFVKKYNGSSVTDKELLLKEKIKGDKKSAIVAFWDKNPWAKEKMSIAVKSGIEIYKKDKADLEVIQSMHTVKGKSISFNIAPRKLRDEIRKWGHENGIDVQHYVALTDTAYNENEFPLEGLDNNKYIIENNKLVGKYCKTHRGAQETIFACLTATLQKFPSILLNRKDLPDCLRNNPRNLLYILNVYEKAWDMFQLPKLKGQYSEDDILCCIDQMRKIYFVIMLAALEIGCEELGSIMNEELDKTFDEKPWLKKAI